jgi:hypothetical protein
VFQIGIDPAPDLSTGEKDEKLKLLRSKFISMKIIPECIMAFDRRYFQIEMGVILGDPQLTKTD